MKLYLTSFLAQNTHWLASSRGTTTTVATVTHLSLPFSLFLRFHLLGNSKARITTWARCIPRSRGARGSCSSYKAPYRSGPRRLQSPSVFILDDRDLARSLLEGPRSSTQDTPLYLEVVGRADNTLLLQVVGAGVREPDPVHTPHCNRDPGTGTLLLACCGVPENIEL